MSSKSKNFALSTIPLLLAWLIDFQSKRWAENLQEIIDLGLVRFELVYNHGVMMGWLSHLPGNIKTTVIATIGAMIPIEFGLKNWTEYHNK